MRRLHEIWFVYPLLHSHINLGALLDKPAAKDADINDKRIYYGRYAINVHLCGGCSQSGATRLRVPALGHCFSALHPPVPGLRCDEQGSR